MRDKQPDGDGGGWSANKDASNIDGNDYRMTINDAQRMREMQLSIAASSSVFPGFRFSPTDDELISYYLKKKLQGSDNCVDIIPEVDFCRHEPWDLPALSIVRSDNEWFFFSARGKKYPNGSQSKRATQSGYWKATGKERNVKSGVVTIGTKRTLVFHTGRAPKGERTEWIMHEYCMSDATQESLVVCRLRRNSDFRLNESSRGSSNNMTLSVHDNSQSVTNEDANHAQMDGFDHEANNIKSCSKETSSSYRSVSFEQNDSGSESDRQLVHESPHGSSSLCKQYDDGDDCFADIINDDIIKLDESASNSLRFHGVLAGDLPLFVRDPTTCLQKLPPETLSADALSGQGTAFRRIRLRHQNVHNKLPPSGAARRNAAREHTPSQKNETGCVISVLSGASNAVSTRVQLVLALMTTLVVIFVAWRGGRLPLYSKEHSSVEGLRRQLRYWLQKAADYI